MKKIIFVAVLLLAPSFVFANVRINEVAWMGTSDSSTGEWIELYNDGDSPIDITDWTLSIGTRKLTGIVPGKGFLLLKRTADYTGALTDGGLKLSLYDSAKTEIDFVFAACNPPGKGIARDTIQRNGDTWIVAPETPNISNATIAGTGKNGTCEINGVKNQTETDTATDTTDTTQTSSPSTTLDTSAHVSPLPLSDFSRKQELYISAGRNRVVSVGSPVVFEAFAIDAKGMRFQNIASVWSFGDGAQGGGLKVTHTYKYPGDYVVVLNANAGGNEAVSRAEVRVFAPKIALGEEDGGSVSLMNDSAYEINIGGWKIVGAGGDGTFVASSDTIIKEGKKLIFPKSVTGVDFSGVTSVELLSPDGAMVASFSKPKQATTTANTTTAEISLGGLTPKLKKTEAIDEIAEMDAPLIAVSKPKIQQPTQSAAAALFVPEKVQETKDITPASAKGYGVAKQTIVLKKPQGFFAKIWSFFF